MTKYLINYILEDGTKDSSPATVKELLDVYDVCNRYNRHCVNMASFGADLFSQIVKINVEDEKGNVVLIEKGSKNNGIVLFG